MRVLVVVLALGFLLVARPARADEKAAPGFYMDSEGRWIAFRPMYDAWFGPDRYEKRYDRAIAENVGLLGVELFIYWFASRSSRTDWQYPTITDKLNSDELVRFDDNVATTNYLLHPLAGAAHYGATRINGFGVMPSFATAATASLFYEVVMEWREIISINDLIVTPLAGSAVGEFFVQLGDYVNSEVPRPRPLREVVGSPAFARNISRVTVGLPRRTHDLADSPIPPPPVPDDSLGLSSAYAHDFSVSLGGRAAWNELGDHEGFVVVNQRAAIVAMPGFLRPGTFSTWFSNGNFVSERFELGFWDELRTLELEFDARLFGHYAQSFEAGRGGVHGFARTFAVRTGLHFYRHWLNDRHDLFGVIHAFSPTSTFWFGFGPTKVRLDLDIAPDYAGIDPLAYRRWTARYGRDGTKQTIQSNGYYHAWGVSSGAGVSVVRSGLGFSLRARGGWYESIDGLDRSPSPEVREPHMKDRILEMRGEVSYQPSGTVFEARAEVLHLGRRSEMPPFVARTTEQSLGATLGARF